MTQTFSDGTPIPDDEYAPADPHPDWTPPPRGAWTQDEKLIGVLSRIATALETIAQNGSRGPSAPPGAPVPPPAQGMPPKASNGPDTTKMGKKVFAICKAQGWEIPEVGERITGRPMGANSQKWSFDDLKLVLDTFGEWGV